MGIVDTTPGGASCSTLGTSKCSRKDSVLVSRIKMKRLIFCAGESQTSSLLANNESSLKSRSILRKEVLKLIEQLGNPILHKTCKQCLLQ